MMKSWKTTIMGAILAGLTVYQEYLDKHEVKPVTIAVAVAIAVLGFLMKDFDQTGSPKD